MSPIEKIKELPQWLKNGAAAMSLIGVVSGAVIAAEDRYVNEKEAVQSMQMMQQNLQSQITMVQYDFIDDQYYKAKARLRDNPDDPAALEDFQQLKERREALRKELGLQ